MNVEELLRENFADRAGRVAPPPYDLPERTRDGVRRQRRHRLALAAGTLAVALAFGGVLAVRGDIDPGGGVAGDGGAELGLYTLGTRGSLADDEDFVADVAALDWDISPGGAGRPRPPDEGSVRVVFAGDVPDGRRWALVMGRRGEHFAAAWFTGPAGASADELTLTVTTWPVDPLEPQALQDATQGRGPLVVVGLPGDTVVYDPGWFEEAPGSPGPMPTELRTEDGVAMGTVHRPTGNLFASVTVTREGDDYSVVPHVFDTMRPAELEPAD
jgi:hypothetical protein